MLLRLAYTLSAVTSLTPSLHKLISNGVVPLALACKVELLVISVLSGYRTTSMKRASNFETRIFLKQKIKNETEEDYGIFTKNKK